MRKEFLDIINGWKSQVNDLDALTNRIDRASDWCLRNDPEPDEENEWARMVNALLMQKSMRG